MGCKPCCPFRTTGSRIAHLSRTSNAEAHADMSIYPIKCTYFDYTDTGTLMAVIYNNIPMDIYRCFYSVTDWEFARFVASKNKAPSKRLKHQCHPLPPKWASAPALAYERHFGGNIPEALRELGWDKDK